MLSTVYTAVSLASSETTSIVVKFGLVWIKLYLQKRKHIFNWSFGKLWFLGNRLSLWRARQFAVQHALTKSVKALAL
jgi:hypothetical protein